MIRVYHINVVKVGSCRLICKVYGMLERYVPYREGFKLCITCRDAAHILMIELRKAGRHFSAAGTRCGNDNERTGGFNVIIFAKALIAHDMGNIHRIALNAVVNVNTHAESFKAFFKRNRTRLFAKT